MSTAVNNKGVPFEGSARIPFVDRLSRQIQARQVVHAATGTVDFKPTLLGLARDAAGDGQDEGRDVSALFLTGNAPANWKDVVFSRNADGKWLMAASSRYKFIVNRDDSPRLYDLENDPFEMKNLFAEPTARETVRKMGRALVEYAKQFREPYAAQGPMQADLGWAAGDKGAYTPPSRDSTAKKARRGATETEE